MKINRAKTIIRHCCESGEEHGVKCQVALPCLKVDKLSFLWNSALAGVN